jgi:hypothetical protein
MSFQLSHRQVVIFVGALFLLLFLGLSGVGIYLASTMKTPQAVPVVATESTGTQTANDAKKFVTFPVGKSVSEHGPAVIYVEEVTTTNEADRTWPTVNILRKVGSNEPEVLAQVGGVGAYPGSFFLSPDHKFLLINLESKLQILDLSTNEIRDLFIPKRQALSASYSPDGKELFIWDQAYAPKDGNNSYYVHRFTIADGQDHILKQGSDAGPMVGSYWRDDNKVVLEEGHGDFSRPFIFNLDTNELVKTPGDLTPALLSQNGKIMAVYKDSVPDVCNDYSGAADSVYDVVDPVTADVLGTIGGSGNRVTVLAFSPSGKEAIYVAEKPWTKRDDCTKASQQTYYKVQVATGSAEKLDNAIEVLKSWDPNFVGATADYDFMTNIWSMTVGGKTVVTSTSSFQIAGQFYQ